MRIREGRFGCLVRHFIAGSINNDLLFPAEAGLQNLMAQAAGLLAAPGLIYCLLLSMKFSAVADPLRETLAWPDRFLFVHSSMVLAGMLTVLEWDALFPDRRDYQILMPLPLNRRLVFLAKLASALSLVLMGWAALNLGTSVLFPLMAVPGNASLLTLGRNIAAQLWTTFAASLFSFCALLAVHGILLNLLPPKWYRRIAVLAQLTVLLLLILLLLATPVLAAQADRWIPRNGPWLYAIPSFWFLGQYEMLIGRGCAVFSMLAVTAWKALAFSAALCGAAYFASYRRHLRRSLETLEAPPRGPGMLSRAAGGAFHSVILRGPIERAYFDFIRITLLRSRTHKLLLAGWVGIGLAITFALVAASARSVWAGHPTPALLAVQLSLVFLVLCGIRFVFTVPVELSANWAFQVADPRQKWPGAAAMRKALVTLGACPVLFALLPLHTMLWGWRAAAADLLYGLLVSALLAEALLLGFAKVPFTCTYLPGKANLKAFWSAYAAAFWFYTYTLAALEYRALARPLRFGILCAAVLLGTALLRRLGARPFSRNFRFIFEELPEPAVRSMNIGYGATGEARRSTI